MRHQGTVTLETRHLWLRRFEPLDAAAMYKNWASNPAVTQYLTWPTHAEVSVSQSVLDLWCSLYAKPDYYNWAIVLKTIEEPIGSIAAVDQNEAMDLVHMGYALGEPWWRQGLMTEALGEVIRFFFTAVGVRRIEARHDTRNPNSGKVMQKCGLRYEGTHRQSDRNNQGICDTAWYAMLADDYEALP
ncbi:GNAT family N-acetyltransferase [Oscillospiraceae bacterium HV4-5-C5C]|nr:GNAT family N-acetyltransferase [Oscillospiraceae bacterium HV4-5-C5C]